MDREARQHRRSRWSILVEKALWQGLAIATKHTRMQCMNHSCATGLPISISSSFVEFHSHLQDTNTIAIKPTPPLLSRKVGLLTRITILMMMAMIKETKPHTYLLSAVLILELKINSGTSFSRSLMHSLRFDCFAITRGVRPDCIR